MHFLLILFTTIYYLLHEAKSTIHTTLKTKETVGEERETNGHQGGGKEEKENLRRFDRFSR